MLMRVVAVEEIGLHLQDTIETEGAAFKNLIKLDSASLGFMDERGRIHRADSTLYRQQLFPAHEIGLVEDNNVGEGDLLLRLGGAVELTDEMLGVDHGHDRVELGVPAHVFVDEEGLRHRRRIGETGRLNDDAVELPLSLHQSFDDPDQIAAHGAADAAVVHFEDFLLGVDDQVVVDATPNSLTMTAYR